MAYKYLFLLLICIIQVSGAQNNDRVIKDLNIRVETINSAHIFFLTSELVIENDFIIVKGFVGMKQPIVKGRFDASIISSNGDVLQKLSTEEKFFNRNRQNRRKFYKFVTKIKPSKGLLVRVFFIEMELSKDK